MDFFEIYAWDLSDLNGIEMVDLVAHPSHTKQELTFAAEVIESQLNRILSSPEFNATGQQRAMLKFAVLETLAGRASEIKGYTVATRVFGRSKDFDQATDPIVSIQANKLRRALERYYHNAGQNDPVRISIPRGTYVPAFRQQDRVETGSGTRFEIPVLDTFPSLLVKPFKNLTDDPELGYLATGLATELATEIARYQDIKVMLGTPGGQARRASDASARFALEGSVCRGLSGIKVIISLIDLSNHRHIYGDTHFSESEPRQLIRFQEQVARAIAAKIAGEFGIITRFLGIESKNTRLSQLTTYEAILRYHDFNSNFTQDTLLRAFEALKLAAAKEPQCGLIWSMLARLYANHHTLELSDLETPLEDALAFAYKGARLEPGNQRVRGILAYVLLVANNLEAGIVEAERAIALNPNSLILMDGFGYLLTLLGDWQRGPALIREAMKQNPFYNIIVHHALWVDWVRQEEYRQAYTETLSFRIPTLFWEPLMKAANCGLLGRIAEGRRAVGDLLTLKPDFPSRGRVLIGHYIKFENIADRITDGLHRVGLTLD